MEPSWPNFVYGVLVSWLFVVGVIFVRFAWRGLMDWFKFFSSHR